MDIENELNIGKKLDEIENRLAQIEDRDYAFLRDVFQDMSYEEKIQIVIIANQLYKKLKARKSKLNISIIGVLELLAKLGIYLNKPRAIGMPHYR